MRSIGFYFLESNEETISMFLRTIEEKHFGMLFYFDNLKDPSDSDLFSLVMELYGKHPSAVMHWHVSSKYENTSPVILEVVVSILNQYKAVAFDDFTSHPWTAQELLERKLVQDHPFFDHDGWYNK